MRIEDIELHVGQVDFSYKPVRELRATCEASHAFAHAPNENDINAKLRAMAAKVGANAVINVSYTSGVSITSWKSMTGKGLAVIRESETVPCPHCAELIKRAATKCRFCGEVVEPAIASTTTACDDSAAPDTVTDTADMQPPLVETNHHLLWIAVSTVFVVIMMVLMMQGA